MIELNYQNNAIEKLLSESIELMDKEIDNFCEECEKLRQRFLNGEQVHECDTCYQKEWLSRNDEKDLNVPSLLENIS